MPQKNPTLIAQSQVLHPARPSKAGSGVKVAAALEERESLIDARYEILGYGDCGLTSAERLQLSESIKLGLAEEIELIRKVLKQFANAADEGGEKEYPANLAKTVDLLGLTCSRLANMMRVHAGLTGDTIQNVSGELLEAISIFLEDVEESYGIKHDQTD